MLFQIIVSFFFKTLALHFANRNNWMHYFSALRNGVIITIQCIIQCGGCSKWWKIANHNKSIILKETLAIELYILGWHGSTIMLQKACKDVAMNIRLHLEFFAFLCRIPHGKLLFYKSIYFSSFSLFFVLS